MDPNIAKRDKKSLILCICIFASLVNVLFIVTSVVTPWYKVMDIESTSAAWDCKFLIQRSAFYSYKECDCDTTRFPYASFLPIDWCTDGTYEWRECEYCNTLGCACGDELRIWNTTMGFILIALATSIAVSILYILQYSKPEIRIFKTFTYQSVIHCLNAITMIYLLSAVTIFLRINKAISDDYQERCENTFGVCTEFSGDKMGLSFKYHNFYYTYNESWGPTVGWYAAAVAMFWTLPVIVISIIQSYSTNEKTLRPLYEQIE